MEKNSKIYVVGVYYAYRGHRHVLVSGCALHVAVLARAGVVVALHGRRRRAQ